MKRKIVISAFALSFLFLVSMICFSTAEVCYADAPKDVKIEYDSGAQTLTVTITHKSAFPGFHHIKNVDVKKNAVSVSQNTYPSQPKEVPFSYVYKVAATPGDKLEATVTCNLSGSKSATLTVPAAGNAGK